MTNATQFIDKTMPRVADGISFALGNLMEAQLRSLRNDQEGVLPVLRNATDRYMALSAVLHVVVELTSDPEILNLGQKVTDEVTSLNRLECALNERSAVSKEVLDAELAATVRRCKDLLRTAEDMLPTRSA